MNKRHYEHTLPNIRGSLSNTYDEATDGQLQQFRQKLRVKKENHTALEAKIRSAVMEARPVKPI